MDSWQEEVETVRCIFSEELSIVEESPSFLLRYNVQGDAVVTIRIDGEEQRLDM